LDCLNQEGNIHIHWLHEDIDDVNQWVVYQQRGERWTYDILTADNESLILPISIRSEDGLTPPEILDTIAVTAIDRLGNESKRSLIPVR